MAEDETDILRNSDDIETTILEPAAPDESKEPDQEPKEPTDDPNELDAKRGRMVATGFITAVILSIVVVFVAGIFQISARLLAPSTVDLPINDPAPILWNSATAAQPSGQSLGVSEKIAPEVKLKETSASDNQ